MHSWDSNPRTLGRESYPITPRPERAPALQHKSLIALFSPPPDWNFVTVVASISLTLLFLLLLLSFWRESRNGPAATLFAANKQQQEQD